MSRLRRMVGVLASWTALAAAASMAEPADDKLPWQRLLQGGEATRAGELARSVETAWQAGKLDDALRSAEELLELRQKAQGKDHWQAVDARWQVEALRAAGRQGKEEQQEYAGLPALDREGQALEARGRHRDALPLRQKALEIRRKILGEEHPDTATSVDYVAANLDGQSKYREAEEGSRKALEIRRKVLGEEHPSTAQSHNNLADTLRGQGKYVAAEAEFRTALDVFRKVLGEEHSLTGITYNNLAATLEAHGNYGTAEENHRKALNIFRKAFGEDHANTATSYNNLAANLNAQGKYAEAEESFRRALDLFRKILGEDHPSTATSYSNVAFNLNAQGKYREAEEGYRKALDICRRVLGEDHQATALCYSGVAVNLHAQSKDAAAEEYFRKALEIRRKLLGEEHPHTALAYNNLANNLQEQEKYAEAEEALQKALAIQRKVLGEEHINTAYTHNNLALNLAAQGKYKDAEEGYRKAQEIFRKVLGDEHAHTARSCSNVASNLHAQGRYDEAEKLWVRAADGFARARLRLAHSGLERAGITGEYSPLPALAAVLARNGKQKEAWQRYEESLARGTWDDLSARLSRPPAEQAQQAALTARLDRLDRLIEKAVAIKEETPEQKEKREELLGHRRKAQEELDRYVARLEKTYGPAAGQVFDLATIQAALPEHTALVGWIDRPARTAKAADPSGEHWAFLLRARGEPVCVSLTGSGTAGAWTSEDTSLPGRLRAALQAPQEEWQKLTRALHKQRLQPLEKSLQATEGLPAVGHLVVLPSSALAGVPLEPVAGDLTISYASSGTLFAHLRKQPAVKSAGLLAVGDPVFETGAATAERPLPPHGVLLTFVQPGSNAAAAGLRPDDVLLAYGETELKAAADLKPEPESATTGPVRLSVWRNGKTVEVRIRPGKLGVVMANKPAPEALVERYRIDRVLATRSGDDRWAQLPGTRVEVESLRRLFGDSGEPKLLVDSDASEQALDALARAGELGRYRYLHLATHGEVNDSVALRSAVILSRDHLPDPQQQLLAGKPVYDGRLTAEEMLRDWHLNADLVTLSACQTALGKYQRGEGFMGFAQALTLCGSRSVCLSLWKVDDAATALLMQRFYRNLLGKREGLKGPMPKGAALREAKDWLRNLSRADAQSVAAQVSQGVERGKGRPRQKLLAPVPDVSAGTTEDRPYAHPYYWAAFILIGDPG
jgi:tetratricopeptide (TPR) repeat protein